MRATITVLRAHLTSVWKCTHFIKPYFSIDFSLVIATATTVVPAYLTSARKKRYQGGVIITGKSKREGIFQKGVLSGTSIIMLYSIASINVPKGFKCRYTKAKHEHLCVNKIFLHVIYLQL